MLIDDWWNQNEILENILLKTLYEALWIFLQFVNKD